MANFTNIPIGTSNPINICDGLALLPTGAARAGLSGAGQTNPLFSKNITIVAWQYNASASYSYFFGVCGPSVAFLWNTDVVTSPVSLPYGELGVTVLGDNMQAGFVIGANFGANVTISSYSWSPYHWYSPWKGRWVQSWSASLAFSFDFINLIISLILLLLDESGKKDTLLQKLDDASASALTSSWGMFDQEKNQLISGGTNPQAPDAPAVPGVLWANPTFTLPINLVALTKALPPPGDALYAFNEMLGKIGGWCAFGPTISLEVPVKLALENFFVDGNEYDIDGYDAAGSAITASGDAPISDNPQVIGADVSHTAGFTIGFGLFFSLGALKVFSISLNTSPPVDLFKLLGLPNPIPTTTVDGAVATQLSGGSIFEPVTVTIALPAAVNAGSSATGTVKISKAATTDLKIALTADKTSANIPASVTIPAGQTSANFAFTPGNGCVSEGTSGAPGSSYTVTITAAGVVPPRPTAQTVVSNHPLTVNSTTVDVTISVNPTVSGTITLPWAAPADTPIALTLLDYAHDPDNHSATFDGGQAFPATVTIPEGQSSLPLTLTFNNGGPGYAFGFFLHADGGCAFGNNEIKFNVLQ